MKLRKSSHHLAMWQSNLGLASFSEGQGKMPLADLEIEMVIHATIGQF